MRFEAWDLGRDEEIRAQLKDYMRDNGITAYAMSKMLGMGNSFTMKGFLNETLSISEGTRMKMVKFLNELNQKEL